MCTRRAGSFSEQLNLLHRDYLRADSVRAAQHAFKRSLAHLLQTDRQAYVEAKAPFVWAPSLAPTTGPGEPAGSPGLPMFDAARTSFNLLRRWCWSGRQQATTGPRSGGSSARSVAAGETFAYDPEMDERTARESWMVGPPGRKWVAVAPDGTVIGSANMCANREGGGAHIASASFMVDPAPHGQGAGRALGEDALDWARASGFRGMQFNAVVESNTRAIDLWKSLGFEIIGTIPEGFRHPTKGYLGLHVMFRRL